ncbi:Transcriptional coactivator hfi1 [Smittium culicis]|uniref:Transcriptional coactivator hfi1 n=2 Tax=Smittium culicis TaxID=133412 RepID=A0A1R1WZQ9_9FUNG|nr:Transcriptional coactivator hfi1 [Smittium culicis]
MLKRKVENFEEENDSTQNRISRIDLVEIREKLALALGDSGAKYWSMMSQFLLGKISMIEFEALLSDTLNDNNGILRNARSEENPPEEKYNFTFGEKAKQSDQNKKRKPVQFDYKLVELSEKGQMILAKIKKEGNDNEELNKQWIEFKKLIKSLSKADKRKFEESPIDQAIRIFERVILPTPANKLPPTYALDLARGITSPLCYDTKSTPDKKSLHARMISSALQNGLVGGVTDESVELLLYGLDCHLKNIASNMIYKIRSNRALGIPVKRAMFQKSDLAFMNEKELELHQSNKRFNFTSASENNQGDWDGVFKKPKSISRNYGIETIPRHNTTRLCDRIYNSKQTLQVGDLLFSLNLSPFVTVENPNCLEKGIVLASMQQVANSFMECNQPDQFSGGNRIPSNYIPGIKRLPKEALETLRSKMAELNSAETGTTGSSEGPPSKKCRIRAQYERRFGSIINVNINNSAEQ